MVTVAALLPCRRGSERIAEKNMRAFGPNGESLFEIKLRQLLRANFITEIIVSTNDPECVRVAERFTDERIRIDIRPESLSASSTSLSDLIRYFGGLLSSEYFLWTHVTSPFVTDKEYTEAWRRFLDPGSSKYDSLISVELVQDFFMFEGEPVNFGNEDEFWPRSQDLRPVQRLTSGIFLGPTNLMQRHGQRIGEKPMLFELASPQSIDIDWPEEFESARRAFQHMSERRIHP